MPGLHAEQVEIEGQAVADQEETAASEGMEKAGQVKAEDVVGAERNPPESVMPSLVFPGPGTEEIKKMRSYDDHKLIGA